MAGTGDGMTKAFEFMAAGGDVLRALCAARKQPGMLLAASLADGVNPLEEIPKAAPYLSADEAMHLWHYGTVYLLFQSEEEMHAAYWRTVGDDGPTKTNPYNGPAKVYALTCGADGLLQNENT